MAGQEIIALLIVGATAVAFGAVAWRRRRLKAFERATGCGCGGSSHTKGPSVIISGRKGEKPKVLIR